MPQYTQATHNQIRKHFKHNFTGTIITDEAEKKLVLFPELRKSDQFLQEFQVTKLGNPSLIDQKLDPDLIEFG